MYVKCTTTKLIKYPIPNALFHLGPVREARSIEAGSHKFHQNVNIATGGSGYSDYPYHLGHFLSG